MQEVITTVEGWERIETSPKNVSTAIAANSFVSYDGATGGLEPATAGSVIAGLCLQTVAATDPDYASATPIAIQTTDKAERFLIPVTTGTATAAMVGDLFDLTDALGLDVSGAGTQIKVTKFISATLVEGVVVLNS